MDILFYRWVEPIEKQWRENQQQFSIHELAEIFEGQSIPQLLLNKIQEARDLLTHAERRITESYLHSRRDSEAEPICQAVAGIIYRDEAVSLRTRINRLEWQHHVLTVPRKIQKEMRRDAREIKSLVDLKTVVESSGIRLRKRGRVFVGLCPFHKEKNPSFTVFQDNGYKCFSCGESGDVFTFLQKSQNCSFNEAYELLEKYA